MKKLIDMTEKSTPKYKYLQWKDQTYFKYIKRLLKIAIDQKVNEKEWSYVPPNLPNYPTNYKLIWK